MKVPQKEIDWAIEIAEGLPERYREAAFCELLKYSLSKKFRRRPRI